MMLGEREMLQEVNMFYVYILFDNRRDFLRSCFLVHLIVSGPK